MPTRSGAAPARSETSGWPSALASLCVGVLFLSFWLWVLPRWLGLHIQAAQDAPWRWIFTIPSALGFAVALRCVWDFGWTGRGTPAPIAPPRNLVVVGFYRYVRNPMYVGFFSGWIGLWIVFGHFNLFLATIVAAVVIGIHLFVRFYEEPVLRKKFDGEYERFCEHVPRWLPRLTPWEKS